MKYDVFISHSGADLEIAEQICDYLQDHGISSWIDSRNVSGSYARSIIEGIKESELMVLVFSKNVNNSMHVENEIDNAFCMGKTIIPFRVDPVPYSDVLRYYLNKAHYIDVMQDFKSALDELCIQIRRNLPQHQKSEQIENALKILSEQSEVDVESLRSFFEYYRKNRPGNNLLENFVHGPINESDKYSYEVESDTIEKQNVADIKVSNDNTCNYRDGRYDILQNAAGEILVIISKFESEPNNPRFVYDGGESMLFYRNIESSTVLDSIADKAREALMKVESILVIEIFEDDVAREYKVPLRKIKPLDKYL